MTREKKFNYHYITLIFTFILLCLMIYSLYGIFAEEQEEKEVRISVIVEDNNSSRWTAFMLGLEHAAKEFHAELTIVPTARFDSAEEEWELIGHKGEDGTDGIILAPVSSEGIANLYEHLTGENRIVFVENQMETDENTVYPLLSVTADYKEMGRTLVDNIKEDFGNELKNKKYYLLCSNSGQLGVKEAMEYVKEALLNEGCIYQNSIDIDQDENKNYLKHGQADLLIAFDDFSLNQISKDIKQNNLDRLSLYGIGLSESNVYYLEQDIIKNLIAVNEFQMGYQSLSVLAEAIRNHTDETKHYTIGFQSIRKGMIHSAEYEKLLFPNIQ